MSGRNGSSHDVRLNKTGSSYAPNGTGTTVAGVVAGGATINFSGGCTPIPGPGLWAERDRVASRDPTSRKEPR